jgi:hypothetical protein
VPTGDRKRGDDESTHGVFKIILSRRFSRESPTPAPRPEKTIECSPEMILIQIHPSGNKDQSAEMEGHDSSSPIPRINSSSPTSPSAKRRLLFFSFSVVRVQGARVIAASPISHRACRPPPITNRVGLRGPSKN